MSNDCCKCRSTWEVNKTYLKGFLERAENAIYKPYRITSGPSTPPSTRYGFDPQFILESYDYSRLKNIPWQFKYLDRISIDLSTYQSISNCTCKSVENSKLIGSPIVEQDFKLDPNFSAPSLYANGKGKWMAIPNSFHVGLPGFAPYELAKVNIQWQFNKRLWIRKEIENYQSSHWCGAQCPEGPPPCQGSNCLWNGFSDFKFKKWKPPGFFE